MPIRQRPAIESIRFSTGLDETSPRARETLDESVQMLPRSSLGPDRPVIERIGGSRYVSGIATRA